MKMKPSQVSSLTGASPASAFEKSGTPRMPTALTSPPSLS
jgi:hypothetical protein